MQFTRFAVYAPAAALFLVVARAAPCFAQLDGVLGASDKAEATKVNDRIYIASGFGNTFMVKTDDGNVIIDTSMLTQAP
ncbi:MAG TPA: hypothetical protein VGJ26_09395, partial [Pirellulales bacterium]